MRYVCHYEGHNESVVRDGAQCEGTSLFDFKDGFWIDEGGKLTREGDYIDAFGNPVKGLGKYWIPPSRIYYVEKVEKTEGD